MTIFLVVLGLILLFIVWPLTTHPIPFILGWVCVIGAMFTKRPEVEDD